MLFSYGCRRKRGEEGSEEKRQLTPTLLYAGPTNIDKQRSKQEQAKSPDRSVILLSHDKNETIERSQYATMRSNPVILLSHAKENNKNGPPAQPRAARHSHPFNTWKGRTIERLQGAVVHNNHSQENITCLGNTVGQRLLNDKSSNSIKDSTAAQPS